MPGGFEEFFGPISAFVIAGLITALTQLCKNKWGWDDVQSVIGALVLSLCLVTPLNILWNLEPLITAGLPTEVMVIRALILFFDSLIYAGLIALLANGLYSAGSTLRDARRNRNAPK